MASQYFDKWEFTRALDLVNTHPIESKKLFEEYLKKHPLDYSAQIFYASCLINLGELEEAENILMDVEKKVYNDGNFRNLKDRYKHYIDTLVYTKIRLFSYKREYQKMHTYCMENLDRVKELRLGEVYFYSKAKLGIVDKCFSEDRNDHTYIYRQIYEYSYDDFLNHISKHLADNNEKLVKPNGAIFAPDFPLDKLLKEVIKYIPSDKAIITGFFEEKYVFKFDECGRVDNKLTDYFKVVVFEGTQNFITIYPTANYKYFPSVDLNYLKEKIEEPVAPRKSRIDRFNERLNKGKK